jgi:hypothetical protein
MIASDNPAGRRNLGRCNPKEALAMAGEFCRYTGEGLLLGEAERCMKGDGMLLRWTVMLAVVAAASLLLGGCEEGGPFFTDIEKFVNHEGVVSSELTTQTKLYRQSEMERPGQLAGDVKGYRIREETRDRELSEDTRRMRNEMRQYYPNWSTMARSAAEAPAGTRDFPNPDK